MQTQALGRVGFSRCTPHAPWPGLPGPVVLVHGLGCPVTAVIFPDQGWNTHPLHWAGRFLTAEPPGKPSLALKKENQPKIGSAWSGYMYEFSSVTQSCLTLCKPMHRNTPGLPVHRQLPEFTQTHVCRVGDAIQPSHPLLSPFPPTFNLSQHQGFYSESVLLIRWSKDWSFSFSISPSKEYSG